MLNLYPANRTENLVLLLDKILSTANDNILSADIILVQSKGMQHWLNMQLAEQTGICMNLSYQMPAQFFWQTLRHILGADNVPEHSVFSREVMCWRLYQLLALPEFVESALAIDANHYWQAHGDKNASKRFQLAWQLADLFEQYLIYRPDWIEQWQSQPAEHWQGLLWQLLVAQQPINVASLTQQAMDKLAQNQQLAPERLCVFGINALPPLILNFLSELANYSQVHLFHLNPCEQYWGDVATEKQRGKQLLAWLEATHDENEVTINPLLANLGQQGRDFLSLLPHYCTNEIPVFEAPETLENRQQTSVLAQLQNDILTLHDARKAPCTKIDDSITFTSSHSRLREIQGLHDWLLHQLNNDASLTPKDILVMCPQVEDYAPYIDAVFSRGGELINESVPPLPCSIADRTLKNATPLIDTFEQLLTLPDSRFQLSQILAYLRLPAISHKFAIDETMLNTLSQWLQQASVHWGLNAEHKNQFIVGDSQTNAFTWQQGLERLLLGFAFQDSDMVVNDQLLLESVEGDQALLLGKLMQLLELLQYHCWQLTQLRTPNQWHTYLLELKDSLFSQQADDANAWQILVQAIDDFAQYCHQANFDQAIPLAVVKAYFNDHFATSDASQQFLTGQVTFCSMIPMRSIPFKIIAILGMNDGDYPRQRPNLSFDLMAQEPPRAGDRSRRGDDRYLFLEALISCREKLYLSFQGNDIKNNNQRESSIIIKELIDYLTQGYGWQFNGNNDQLQQLPMQAFSLQNYRGMQTSFNPHWLTLANKMHNNAEKTSELSIESPVNSTDEITLTLTDLSEFFHHPIKRFAQQNLGLYLSERSQLIEDTEPFTFSGLDKYLFQQASVQIAINNDNIAQHKQQLLLSGRLPDNHIAEDMVEAWWQHSKTFAAVLVSCGVTTLTPALVSEQFNQVNVAATLHFNDANEQIIYRQAAMNGKDKVNVWLHHLLANCVYPNAITTHGFFYHEKLNQVVQVTLPPISDANSLFTALLEFYLNGMQSPTCISCDLAEAVFGKKDRQGNYKTFEQQEFNQYWHNSFSFNAPAFDKYYQYFYQQCPQWDDIKDDLTDCYLHMYNTITAAITIVESSE